MSGANFRRCFDFLSDAPPLHTRKRVAKDGDASDQIAQITTTRLDEVQTFIERYVVLSTAQTPAVALWVLHTHAIEAADYTPYLAISSAEKQSGKTTLLDVLELVVRKPWLTGFTTASALVRKVDSEEPTLLLDEVDAALGSGQEYTEALRGLLNSGFKRGGVYSMSETNRDSAWKPRDYNVFSAKAFALIGELPDTVESRSIPIRMKPKLASDRVERLRARDVRKSAEQLRRALGTWGERAVGVLKQARPDAPDFLSNRALDVWEPLLAIADFAGGQWPELARKAAAELLERREEESLGVRLLRDVRSVLTEERIASDELVRRLTVKEESPWGGWAREWRDTFTPRDLAKLLKPYDIQPQAIWFGTAQKKGYYRASFEDAWKRYLPTEKVNRVNMINEDEAGGAVRVDPVDGVDLPPGMILPF